MERTSDLPSSCFFFGNIRYLTSVFPSPKCLTARFAKDKGTFPVSWGPFVDWLMNEKEASCLQRKHKALLTVLSSDLWTDGFHGDLLKTSVWNNLFLFCHHRVPYYICWHLFLRNLKCFQILTYLYSSRIYTLVLVKISKLEYFRLYHVKGLQTSFWITSSLLYFTK